MTFADDEILQGYRDGLDPCSPKPTGNRTPAYCHGWLNGRDDLSQSPRASAATLRSAADQVRSKTDGE
jgi:hypothetical protein